jgi:pimeloyl-ACP methyl ester carboxylesterase
MSMGNSLSLEAWQPFQRLLFPAPHPLRSWSVADFQQAPGVPAYTIRAPDPVAERWVIHCHGNATDVEGMDVTLRKYVEATGANFVSWEYPGYGPRPGPCTAAQMKADIVALYDHLVAKHGLRPHQISVLGHSIGSGPAVWLASQRPFIRKLILLSPYTSIRDIVAEWLPATWLSYVCPPVFDNLTAIRQVTCPVLFIHGKKDDVIPWTHTQRLAETANHALSKRICYAPEATHNDWDWETEVLGPVQEFLLL